MSCENGVNSFKAPRIIPATKEGAPAWTTTTTTCLRRCVPLVSSLLWSAVPRGQGPGTRRRDCASASRKSGGWIPHFLERAQRSHHRRRYWTKHGQVVADRSELLGREVDDEFDAHQLFRDHIFGCVITDTEPFALDISDHIGIDVIVETDYPVQMVRGPTPSVQSHLSHLSNEARYQVLQGNARRAFSFEPALA
jgi:hypothetical protein